jgi:hypothetical protein
MADPSSRKAANESYFADRHRSIMGSGQQLSENGSVTTLRTATIGGGDGEPAYIIPTYDPSTKKVYDLSKPEERAAAMKMVEPDIKSGKLQPYDTWQEAEADLKDFYPRVIKSHITEEGADPSRRLDIEHVSKAEDRRRAEALARMNARVDALEQQDAAAAAPDPNAAGEKDSGRTLADLGFTEEIWPMHWAVKESVFPFNRFHGQDILLSPEMRSTGEVMGLDADLGIAYAKLRRQI